MRLLAQELEAQPLDLLDEHQDRATGSGLLLAAPVPQAPAPAPKLLEPVVLESHPVGSIAEAASSLGALRKALAVVVWGVALAGAAFLGAAHLKDHGVYHCYPGATPGTCDVRYSYWTVGRFWWQIPIAIVIALAGAAVAVVLAKRSAPES